MIYKTPRLIRFWFEFEKTKRPISDSVQIGCGVTAFNYLDALHIIVSKIFKDTTLPEITKCIANIDIRALDQRHVIPNMGTPSERGVWYPLGYHDYK